MYSLYDTLIITLYVCYTFPVVNCSRNWTVMLCVIRLKAFWSEPTHSEMCTQVCSNRCSKTVQFCISPNIILMQKTNRAILLLLVKQSPVMHLNTFNFCSTTFPGDIVWDWAKGTF